MTLDELIAALEKMREAEGGDTIVVVRGYESGYDRVDDVDTLDVYDSRAEGGYEKWWDGRYDESALFAGVKNADPIHVVHLVSATDKTFD